MKKATPKTIGGKRLGAGRPATGRDPSRTFRLSDELMANVDGWAAAQSDEPGRSEALRRLVELGLKAKKRQTIAYHARPPKALHNNRERLKEYRLKP